MGRCLDLAGADFDSSGLVSDVDDLQSRWHAEVNTSKL